MRAQDRAGVAPVSFWPPVHRACTVTTRTAQAAAHQRRFVQRNALQVRHQRWKVCAGRKLPARAILVARCGQHRSFTCFCHGAQAAAVFAQHQSAARIMIEDAAHSLVVTEYLDLVDNLNEMIGP